MRLQKYIADAGICSRRKAEELIKNGEVKVNGVVVDVMGVNVSDGDEVMVSGVSEDELKVFIETLKKMTENLKGDIE